jgi:Holliday junction resolvase RusA-like endonuclease
MDAISFTVAGDPVPQPRIRATRTGRVYTPAGAHGPYKAAIGLAAAMQARRIGWQCDGGPIAVWIEFVFGRPPSHHNARGELRPKAPAYPGGGTGDIDNLEKAVLDAINDGGGVWLDDRQVVFVTKRKRYAGRGEPARTAVWIRRDA